jgi:DnaK suppressor protein
VKAPSAKSTVVSKVSTAGAKLKPAKMPPSPAASDSPAPEIDKDNDKSKDSVKTTTAKASKSEAAVPKPKVARTVAAGIMAKSAVPAKVVVAPVIESAPVASPSTPARAGRPSSRLAQLTVPSMAQSVASTAAKASFMQTTELPMIVPPLASAVKKDPKLVNNWKLKPVDQLTDADLTAMPDDEYMNDTQMAYFRLKLTKIKQDILSNAGETTEHLREDTVVVPDPADRATIEEEHALELRTRDRERKLLKKIEQSIQRIDSGDYGYCDETGEPIGVGRLLARPTANLSLEAQQRRELKQKMFGD